MTIDERLERIERSLENLVRSHENLTRSHENLTRSHENLIRSHDNLTQYVLDFRQEAAIRLQTIENRLDVLSSTVASLDARFPALNTAILDFGTLTTQLVREQ